jgi:hypothetical protein
VHLLPCAAQQRGIGGILDQGVLKDIPGPWGPAPLIEEFGGHQLRQPCL